MYPDVAVLTLTDTGFICHASSEQFYDSSGEHLQWSKLAMTI